MDKFFANAKPIFVQKDNREPVVSCGYRADFEALSDCRSYKLNITGRSFYRLYVNGTFVMHGPARTARGYLRVDEIELSDYIKAGKNVIAIEQISFSDPYNSYSNNITLEPGVILFEIFDEGGNSIVSSSKDINAIRLINRHQKVERRSHCREAVEIYDIDNSYFGWRDTYDFSGFVKATEIECDFKLLPRRMFYPDMTKRGGAKLVEFGSFAYEGEYKLNFYEQWGADFYNNPQDHLLRDLVLTREHAGNAKVSYIKDGVKLISKGNSYLSYDLGESFVGFTGFKIKTDKDIIIDLVCTELTKPDGTIMYDFNTGTRLYIKAGEYSFTRFDPCLARYFRLYIRGEAEIEITDLHMISYSYPDLNEGTFTCSDEDVNRLYNAARKTLILNTLDIFMDCPDRERGGWLCDSFWTARAAAVMLGDTKVEKAFIENFLLTDPALYKYGLFPSVYPNTSGHPSDELATWSFWLLAEIAEYVRRSGDIDMIKEHSARIDAVIDGALGLRGDSGLLENVPIVFIDWSQSNSRPNTQPISVPCNALYAYAVREYGRVMNDSARIALADEMMETLKKAVLTVCNEKERIPDSLTFKDGAFVDNGVYTEAAHFTSLWAELLGTDFYGDMKEQKNSIKLNVVDKMGPMPKFKAHPNIGKSGLFIGDCVRFDMLVKLGRIETMFDEIKYLFFRQLKEGPGTLWENEVIEATSRCHGFNAHVGVHLTRDILGIADVCEAEKKITIAPHPADLRWARGVVKTDCGCLSVSFVCDNGQFELKVTAPNEYKCEVKLPSYVKGLGEENIKIDVCYV